MIEKVYRPDWRPEWREKYGEYQQYAKVYKDAVEVLLTHLKNSGYDHDCQILPLLFLFRHYIELELKGLILFCYTISPDIEDIEKVIKEARSKHGLFELLTYLKSIKIRHIEIKPSDEFKEFIKKFDDLDRQAIRFRYPETKNGDLFYENDLDYIKDKPFFDDLMNLNKISIKIEMVMSELNKLSSYLDGEKDNLFETIQWEQDHENS
ncbi:MAG: hypothetical protein WA102_08980 [Candidatus Methanoperedens sp.]